MFDLLSKNITWVIICALGVPSTGFIGAKLYQSYLKKAGTSAAQSVTDSEAQRDFVACIAAVESETYSGMEFCDRYYLEYIPNKTAPGYKKKALELDQLQVDKAQVKEYYDKLVLLRAEFELDPYKPLSELSNGKITAVSQ